MAQKTRCAVVMKEDYICHRAGLDKKTYLNKLKWRVKTICFRQRGWFCTAQQNGKRASQKETALYTVLRFGSAGVCRRGAAGSEKQGFLFPEPFLVYRVHVSDDCVVCAAESTPLSGQNGQDLWKGQGMTARQGVYNNRTNSRY